MFLRLIKAIDADVALGSRDYHVSASKLLVIKQAGIERDYFFDQIIDTQEPIQNLYNLLFIHNVGVAGVSRSVLSIFIADSVADSKASTFGTDSEMGVIPCFIRDILMKKNSIDKEICIEISAVQENGGEFYDLLAFTGVPLHVSKRMDLMGCTWARIYDLLGAAHLLKLIIINNNSRDFKNSIFEYSSKNPSNLLVSIKLTNNKTEIFYHFAEFVTALDYYKNGELQKLEKAPFLKLLRSLRPLDKVRHIHHFRLGKSKIKNAEMLLGLTITFPPIVPQAEHGSLQDVNLSSIPIHQREPLILVIRNLHVVGQMVDEVHHRIQVMARNKLSLVFKCEQILTMDTLVLIDNIDTREFYSAIKALTTYQVENSLRLRQAKYFKQISRLTKLCESPQVTVLPEITASLSDPVVQQLLLQIRRKVAVRTKSITYKLMFERAHYVQFFINKYNLLREMQHVKQTLASFIARFEGLILDLNPTRHITLNSIASLPRRQKAQKKTVNRIVKCSQKRVHPFISLSSFLQKGPDILQADKPSPIQTEQPKQSTGSMSGYLSRLNSSTRRNKMVEFKQIFDTDRIVSKRLSKTRLVLISH